MKQIKRKGLNAAQLAAAEENLVMALNSELFRVTEQVQGEAWISDDPGTRSLAEFFEFIEGFLLANREASNVISAFLRKYRRLRASSVTATHHTTPSKENNNAE